MIWKLNRPLKEWQKNKTPGSDGLSAEFYVCFWKTIGADFCDVVKEIFDGKRISESMREGIITLIFKKGDRGDMENWRPITLLNVDYKAVAKIVANRLREVLGKIIGPWQTCALPGRRISDNLILLRDMVVYANRNKRPLVVMSLDLEKAYDRISHVFMFEVMRKLGLPGNLLGVIKGFYNGIKSRVLVNGALSESFVLRAGVRQGCPLSPLAFICVIEPFLVNIQKEKVCKGFVIPGGGGQNVKSMAYMDDVLIIGSEQREINRVGLVTEIYCAASKMKVNWKKSCLCNLGVEVQIKRENLEVKKEVKVLGITFDKVAKGKDTYKELTQKVQKKLEFWALRELSLRGKILILKAVIFPLILYTALVFPMAKVWTMRTNKIMFNFLWGTKMERVARVIVKKPCGLGGLGFPDLEKFMDMNVWLLFFRLVKVDSRASNMVRYMGGWLFRRWGWRSVELGKPVSFLLSVHYKRLEKIGSVYNLMPLGLDGGDKGKVRRVMYRDDIVSNIRGLRSVEAVSAWSALSVTGLSNRQHDVAWLALHNALSTREFLKGRDIVRSDRCPREGCGGVESVQHLFWECEYARNVREVFGEFTQKVCNNKLTYLGLLTNIGLGKVEGRNLGWIFSCILKEVLWDMRNQLVVRKEEFEVEWCCRMVLTKLHVAFLLDVKEMGEEKSLRVWKRRSWNSFVKVGVG